MRRGFVRTPAKTQRRDGAIAVATQSEKKASFHISIIRATGVAPDYIALGPSPRWRSAGSETPSSSFPPWPGNYPNLPSSCAAAPVQRWLGPPLWLHYQRWSSLMARRRLRAGCWQRQTGGGKGKRWWPRRRRRKRKRRNTEKSRHLRGKAFPQRLTSHICQLKLTLSS